MADRSFVQSAIGGVPGSVKLALTRIFDYLLKDIRLGRPGDKVPSVNFPGHFYQATTPAVADTEFTIAHRFSDAPYLVLPVLQLDAVNSTVVDLTVTRAADANRIYLKSSVANAPVTLYVEG